MPSSKNSSDIVVRPAKRGAAVASKTVLGTMNELNRHAPLAEIAPHLVYEDPKPWKQSSRSVPRRTRGMRRNAGRNDGRTWVSRQFVCETEEDADWDVDLEILEDASDMLDSDHEGVCGEARPPLERMEVGILDIAKPARLRGIAREYEMVPSVSRVVPLDDEQWVEVNRLAEDTWESIEMEMRTRPESRESYAAVLRV